MSGFVPKASAVINDAPSAIVTVSEVSGVVGTPAVGVGSGSGSVELYSLPHA